MKLACHIIVLDRGGTMDGAGACREHAQSLTKHWTRQLFPLPGAPKTTTSTDVRCIGAARAKSEAKLKNKKVASNASASPRGGGGSSSGGEFTDVFN